jgi:phosphate transport system permease protein
MRRWVDRVVGWLLAAAAFFVCGLLVAILVTLVWRALAVLGPALLLDEVQAAGADGGLRGQIVGTLLLAATSLAIAVPLGAASALALRVFAPRSSVAVLELGLYTAAAIPSVLWGVVAFVVFTGYLDWGKSWLAGGITLGLMAVPTVALALAQRIAALPARYLEAGRALGMARHDLIWRVILPQTRDGLVSGSLLAVARAAGETAPILFCAAVFSGASWPPVGVANSPVLALPYHIFVLAQDAVAPGAQQRLWGAAVVLVAVSVGLAAAALPLRLGTREAQHG